MKFAIISAVLFLLFSCHDNGTFAAKSNKKPGALGNLGGGKSPLPSSSTGPKPVRFSPYPSPSTSLLGPRNRVTLRPVTTAKPVAGFRTPFQTITNERKAIQVQRSGDGSLPKENFLVGRKVTYEYNPGLGSVPKTNARVTDDARVATGLIKPGLRDPHKRYQWERSDGSIAPMTGKQLNTQFGNQFIAGHIGNAKLGTRGLDRNMIPITGSLNTAMSKRVEEKTKGFLRDGTKSGLIQRGDRPVQQEFSVGKLGFIGDGSRRVPVADDLTIKTYLNVPPRLQQPGMEAQKQKLVTSFQSHFYDSGKPVHKRLHPVTDKPGQIGYGGTFSNRANSHVNRHEVKENQHPGAVDWPSDSD